MRKTCKHCGQDIERFSSWKRGEWRDRGNNLHCPTPAGDAGQVHEPYNAPEVAYAPIAQVQARRDFVVILAPTATILRPVTERAREFVATYYASHPKGLALSLAFDPPSGINEAIEALSAAGLTLETL